MPNKCCGGGGRRAAPCGDWGQALGEPRAPQTQLRVACLECAFYIWLTSASAIGVSLVQDIARKQRDIKLGTLETDIDDVFSKLQQQQKKTEQLSDMVNRLNQEVEEERSARRLLEKVLLKMAEEQTLKVVERECAKERNARDSSMKKMKQYADLIHEKITTREREAAAERQVQRSMIQVLARTRRALNKLHEQVMNNQGDLEERIATDIAHLNTRCKELQAAVDHSSLKASHDNEGVRKEMANNIEILRVNTMDAVGPQ